MATAFVLHSRSPQIMLDMRSVKMLTLHIKSKEAEALKRIKKLSKSLYYNKANKNENNAHPLRPFGLHQGKLEMAVAGFNKLNS